jgi:hypothetical protein
LGTLKASCVAPLLALLLGFEAFEDGVAVDALEGGAVFLEALAFGFAAAFAALPAAAAASTVLFAHGSILARLAPGGPVA